MMGKTWALAILLILPSTFLFVGNHFNRAYYAADPDYIYLMNALNLARGKDAGHIDNPGTPVMEIGCGILVLHHHLLNRDEKTLQEAVLENPDWYVNFIRQFFILLITLALIITGWVVYQHTESIWPALIVQITPYLSVNVLEHAWTKVSPEPVLLFIVTLYMAILFCWYFNKNPRVVACLLLFAVIGGLGLATKATFLPLLVIPFFLFTGWKRKLIYGLSTVAAFFLFTSPAHKQYHSMVRWFTGLITHKGIYGSGEKGFIETGVYLGNIKEIAMNNGYFTIILLIAILALVLPGMKQNTDSKLRQILLALVAAGILGILIVAKHYHVNHYLIPVLALSGGMLVFAIISFGRYSKLKNRTPLIHGTFILLALLIFLLVYLPQLRIKNAGYDDTNREYREAHAILDRDFHDYLRIYHYPDGLNKISALKFGNGYSKLSNQAALSAMYPEAYFFNVMTNRFEYWESPVSVRKILEAGNGRIVFTGRQIDRAGMELLNSFGISVKPVYKGLFQAVYVLDSVAKFAEESSIRNSRIIRCDAETVSLDGSVFIAGNFTVQDGYFRTTEKCRSGDHAFRLDHETEYGFKLVVDSIFPGQEFQCSIWRNSGASNATLVVAADEPGLFYASTHNTFQSDSLGWHLLRLDFSVPLTEPPVHSLNLYLWNKGRELVYFDDLEVIIR